VVLYEDVARRRVKVLVGAMKDLQGLRAALEAFQEVRGVGVVCVKTREVQPGDAK
jgi:hypothetical protein